MDKILTPKQRRAAQSLLTTADTTQAAAAAGVSRDTIYRWLRLPEFRGELQQATGAVMESLARGLVTLGARALAVLAAALDDPEAPQAVKIRAADIILSRLLELQELVVMQGQIEELERRSR